MDSYREKNVILNIISGSPNCSGYKKLQYISHPDHSSNV